MNHAESKLQQQCVAWFFDEFRLYVSTYILASFEGVRDNITEAHKELTAEQEAREKEHFMKVIGKK